jgi:hypothetical protein
MDNRIALGLAAAAVVAFATAGPRSPVVVQGAALRGAEDTVPPPSSPRSQGNANTKQTEYVAERGENLLHRFFGTHWGPRSQVAPDTFSLDVLIATVPDPYDSHLDWSFDALVEAIRRAFETTGYVTDRFWFPSPRDSGVQDTIQGRVPIRELRPGVMLFRHSAPNADSLKLLYLVPELPTRGIYKDAMQAALDERFRLRRHLDLPLRADTADTIRIIGPTFSGSALSLQLAIRGWIEKQAKAGLQAAPVEIVSGSATSRANLETLTCPALRMHFSATINDDESLGRVLADDVLPRLELHRSQVALLRESSTQYGQSLLGADTTFRSQRRSCDLALPAGTAPDSVRPHPPKGRTAPSADVAPATRDSSQFVIIPFPMSISSLRSAYQLAPTGPEAAPALPGSEVPRLPLDLLEPARPKEDLPVTSRLSPVALDLILDEIARTLTRRQVRLVGLLATDVRDKLFLGDEIRKRVRDVQFFTYESNVLYLRADRSRALRGMLVLSTYPLILDNQWSTSGSGEARRLAFGSDGAEGVYNATLVQLGRRQTMLDYRLRSHQPEGAGSEKPSRPPIWITTVGNRVFLPVTRHVPDETGYVTPGCSAAECPSQPQWPRGLPFLPLAAMILSSFVLILFAVESFREDEEVSASLRTLEMTAESHLRPVRDQVIRGSLRLHDRLYDVLRVVALSGVFLAACAPIPQLLYRAFLPGRAVWEGYFVIGLVVLVAAVCGTAALVRGTVSLVRLTRYLGTPGWAYFRYGPWSDWTEKWTWRAEVIARAVVALFGIGYLALSIWFVVDVFQMESFWLFYRRAIEIDSLVSPILPLILGGVGYAVWCSWHIERIALLRGRTTFESACDSELDHPSGPPITIGSALRDDLLRTATVARTIRDRLFRVIPSVGAVGVLVAFFCLVPWLWPRFGLSLESILSDNSLPTFDVLFRSMVLASMFATAWGAYRLLAVWDGLRQCLAGFSRMPIVTAFDRLPPRLARLTRLTLPGFTPVVASGAIADIQWLHLQRIYSMKKEEFTAALLPYNPELLHRVEELMGTPAAQALALDRSGRRSLIARFEGLHRALRELWRLEPMPEDIDALIEGLGKESERGDPAGSATSTTLRVRRSFAGPVRLWLRGAEEYAASRMVEYVEWVIRHLRVLALFLLLSLLLTTLLVSSYPYQPQSLLRLILLLVLVGAVGSVIVVLVQMNRNEVLSRIARTEPGQITWNGTFILNLVTFGVVPLLTLLSSEFPGLRNALFAWVQPLVSALAKQ